MTAAWPIEHAAGPWAPTTSLLMKRRWWESNPLKAALQAAAVPSGSSVGIKYEGVRTKDETEGSHWFVLRTLSFVLTQRPRQESNLVCDLRGVECKSGTPRGRKGRMSKTE